MGKRGPKPKTNEEKRLAGNPGKRKLPPDPTTGEAVTGSPQPPIFMRGDQIASREWRRLSKDLIDRRILTKSNIKALEAYCVNYSIFRRAQESCQENLTFETEKGYVGQHPSISIMNKAQEQMRSWWRILDEAKPVKETAKSKFGLVRSIK